MQITSTAPTGATTTPEPKTWEQAVVLSLVHNDESIIKAFSESQPQYTSPEYALENAPHGLNYAQCGNGKFGQSSADLCNQDPATLKQDLAARGALFRQAAEEVGIDISDIPSLVRLHNFDGKAGLSDYELGMALENMAIQYVCGAGSSRPLSPYDVMSWIKEIKTNAAYAKGGYDQIALMHKQASPQDPIPEISPLSPVEILSLFGRDGEVSKTEWMAHWPQFDSNGNGQLDKTEDLGPPIYHYIFGMGGPSFSENIQNAAAERFAYIDQNGDDIITGQEFTEAVALRSAALKQQLGAREDAFEAASQQDGHWVYEALEKDLHQRRKAYMKEQKDKIKAHGDEWGHNSFYADFYNERALENGWSQRGGALHNNEDAKLAFADYIKGEGKAAYEAHIEKRKQDALTYACNRIYSEDFINDNFILRDQLKDQFFAENPLPLHTGSGIDARQADERALN